MSSTSQSTAAKLTVCFHCGEPVTQAGRWQVEIDGILQPMCCPGCEAVASTIIASGLKDYYRHRTELPEISPAFLEQSANSDSSKNETVSARDSLLLYNSEALQRQFVARLPSNNIASSSTRVPERAEATLIIDGISCAACAWLIEHRVNQLIGVESATLNLSSHRLVVRWAINDIALSTIFEVIFRLGYTAGPFSATAEDKQRGEEGKRAIRRLAVAGVGMMQVMMLAVPLYVGMAQQYEVFMRMASMLLTLPVVLYSARPFFDAAIRDLKTRHLTMDVPVSLAILLAFCASIWSTFNQGIEVYFDSVCMFTFLLLLGRYLEMRARHRMGKAGNNLMTLLPNVAYKVDNQQEVVIGAADIAVGDILRVRPGDPFPADGVVVEGASSVDEAALTGEYLPLSKKIGDPLTGGTMNVESPLLMRVTATGAEGKLSTIMRLLDRAQQEKPKIALIADRIASRFVAAVLLISASVFSYWHFIAGSDHAFFIALSVLVVTCPCALSLATPTTLTAATTALRERGLLISKGHVLETLVGVNRVVFDKTGTLTLGQLSIAQVVTLADTLQGQRITKANVCELIAALEADANHPIARAFRAYEDANNTLADTLKDIKHHPSQGVSAQFQGRELRFGRPDFVMSKLPSLNSLPAINTKDADKSSTDIGQWLLLALAEQPLAWVQMTDTERPHARQLINDLTQRGLAVSMLTGDPSASAKTFAQQLGINDVEYGLSAEDKLLRVRAWQQQGDVVLMVGDGINDVPVLAAADVSLAVNDASDLAKTHADTLLTNGRLGVVFDALIVADKNRTVIRQNIGWSLLYNLVALPLAAAGLVPPWAAAIGMSFSSLLVVLNALRLTRMPKHIQH
ncbi:MAG: heavy metal translocating P-type ATPase [Oleibacter sp.]|nr:heavy metal translocating P-type ATPase [Thalassolituus sp.]